MSAGFDADVEAGLLSHDSAVEPNRQQEKSQVPHHSVNPVKGPAGQQNGKQRNEQRWHKDSLNRYTDLNKDPQNKRDHYLRPKDGKLGLVKVQLAPGFVARKSTVKETWTISPFQSESGIRDIPIGILKWTYQDVVEGNRDSSQLWWKYPIASIGLTFTSWLGNYNPTSNYAARYPPVRYKHFCYAELPRNKTEARPDDESSKSDIIRGEDGRKEQEDEILARHLRPRMLCVVTSYDDPDHFTWKKVDTDQWDQDRPQDKSGEYIFVSYTRIHFQTYPREEIESWDETQDAEEKAKRRGMPSLYERDLHQLCSIGAMTARKAGLDAFWIDVLCIPKAEKGTAGLNAHDSHRICDVARGSNRVVIAVKDSVHDRILAPSSGPQSERQLLQQWATRLWTLPEMLLAPTAHNLEVYRATDRGGGGGGIRLWDTIPKRNMADIAYPADGERVRELVDHFEASVQLTQIELLTLGLECLRGRDKNQYSKADMMYALMTLARRRPVPYKGQSLFEAFAQLSLLNDSNMLLERLMCLLPPGRYGEVEWYRFLDSWGVRLWDVFPTCQVSDIAGGDADQTVLIDGAYGASIEWRHLKKVEFLKRRTLWRYFGEVCAQAAIVWLLTAIVTVAVIAPQTGSQTEEYDEISYSTSGVSNAMIAVPVVFFILAFITMAVLPHAMLSKFRGKFWSTQAVLYGLEGVPDIAWLERQLFGFSEGRLTWSPHGSTLSQHRAKEGAGEKLDGECEALQPLLQNDKAPRFSGDFGDASLSDGERDDGTRIFTLVDTYAMTVTAFRARHPPTVALVLGHEGGMRRAALCSYNHRTQTFHRETVVRMPTKVLDRMDRVDKFRFSLESQPL